MSPKKYSRPIAKFIVSNSEGNPLGVVAEGIGISPSYLSDILNGKKDPSLDVSNKIADYFNVSKFQIYELLGWIKNDNDKNVFNYLIELAKKDPDFVELAHLYTTFTTQEDRRRAIRVLKSLLEDKKNDDKNSRGKK
jgi:transcriptional regulator with XRE-family HTH domain